MSTYVSDERQRDEVEDDAAAATEQQHPALVLTEDAGKLVDDGREEALYHRELPRVESR